MWNLSLHTKALHINVKQITAFKCFIHKCETSLIQRLYTQMWNITVMQRLYAIHTNENHITHTNMKHITAYKGNLGFPHSQMLNSLLIRLNTQMWYTSLHTKALHTNLKANHITADKGFTHKCETHHCRQRLSK